eukprot:112395_1
MSEVVVGSMGAVREILAIRGIFAVRALADALPAGMSEVVVGSMGAVREILAIRGIFAVRALADALPAGMSEVVVGSMGAVRGIVASAGSSPPAGSSPSALLLTLCPPDSLASPTKETIPRCCSPCCSCRW